MDIILLWSWAYLLLSVITGIVLKLVALKKLPLRYNALVAHSGLIISAAIIQYVIYTTGFVFPWLHGTMAPLLFVMALIIAALLIGWFGLFYGLSVLLQELTMLSMAFLLFSTVPLYLIALMVVPPFVLSHFINAQKPFWLRLSLFSAWGVASVVLFYFTGAFLVVVALHIVLGSWLIKKQLLLGKLNNIAI